MQGQAERSWLQMKGNGNGTQAARHHTFAVAFMLSERNKKRERESITNTYLKDNDTTSL